MILTDKFISYGRFLNVNQEANDCYEKTIVGEVVFERNENGTYMQKTHITGFDSKTIDHKIDYTNSDGMTIKVINVTNESRMLHTRLNTVSCFRQYNPYVETSDLYVLSHSRSLSELESIVIETSNRLDMSPDNFINIAMHSYNDNDGGHDGLITTITLISGDSRYLLAFDENAIINTMSRVKSEFNII